MHIDKWKSLKETDTYSNFHLLIESMMVRCSLNMQCKKKLQQLRKSKTEKINLVTKF